jgi:hypothetical protein
MAKIDKNLKIEENTSVKKYSKLLGKIDYDHEAVEQLAEALNEIAELDRRIRQLKQIVDENHELHQFVWQTSDGVTHPIHNIDDEHLTNIMLHLIRTGRPINRAIRGEAMSRDLVIPASVPVDWDDIAERRLLGAKDRKDVY